MPKLGLQPKLGSTAADPPAVRSRPAADSIAALANATSASACKGPTPVLGSNIVPGATSPLRPRSAVPVQPYVTVDVDGVQVRHRRPKRRRCRVLMASACAASSLLVASACAASARPMVSASLRGGVGRHHRLGHRAKDDEQLEPLPYVHGMPARASEDARTGSQPVLPKGARLL